MLTATVAKVAPSGENAVTVEIPIQKAVRMGRPKTPPASDLLGHA